MTHVFEKLLSLGDCRKLLWAHLGLVHLGLIRYVFYAQFQFVTAPCACWLYSTSLPGSNQVDGLLPALSTATE